MSGDLYQYAFLLCQDEVMAENSVQDPFPPTQRFLGRLSEQSKAISWLMTELRRECARSSSVVGRQ